MRFIWSARGVKCPLESQESFLGVSFCLFSRHSPLLGFQDHMGRKAKASWKHQCLFILLWWRESQWCCQLKYLTTVHILWEVVKRTKNTHTYNTYLNLWEDFIKISLGEHWIVCNFYGPLWICNKRETEWKCGPLVSWGGPAIAIFLYFWPEAGCDQNINSSPRWRHFKSHSHRFRKL